MPDNPHKEDTFFLFLYIDLVSFARQNGFVPLFYFLEYPGVLDWFPLKDRTSVLEPRIAETGITVHDISHTNFRAFVVRNYLEIFSKIRFGRKREKF